MKKNKDKLTGFIVEENNDKKMEMKSDDGFIIEESTVNTSIYNNKIMDQGFVVQEESISEIQKRDNTGNSMTEAIDTANINQPVDEVRVEDLELNDTVNSNNDEHIEIETSVSSTSDLNDDHIGQTNSETQKFTYDEQKEFSTDNISKAYTLGDGFIIEEEHTQPNISSDKESGFTIEENRFESEEKSKIDDLPFITEGSSSEIPIKNNSKSKDYNLASKEEKIIKFFNNGKYFIYLLLLVIALTIVNEVKILIEGVVSGSIIDTLYLLLFSIMAGFVYMQVKDLYSTFNTLQDSAVIKKSLQEQNHTKTELHAIAKKLLDNYENIPEKSEEIKVEQNRLKDKVNEPIKKHLENYLYKDFGHILDKKAKKIIADSSVSVGITTALSPVAIFDMLLVLIRTYDMTKQLSLVYGYKPTPVFKLYLLRKAIRNIAFAGVSEVAIDMSIDSVSNTFFTKLFSKVSAAIGQGVSNGLLMSRLGIAIAEECRPIPRKIEKKEIYSEVYDKINEKLTSAKKDK